jgi:anti-anti-sigma factor
METSRPVVVKRVPERVNLKEAREFLRAVEPILHSDRPQVVLDLSNVRHLDSAGVDMLLHCMSEAMKRDGDVKLAAPSPEAMVILELTRTGRLFEIYDSATDAARSFSSFLPNVMRQFSAPETATISFPSAGSKVAASHAQPAKNGESAA